MGLAAAPGSAAHATHGQAHGKDKDKGQRHNQAAEKVEDLPPAQPQEVQALRAVGERADDGRADRVAQLPREEDGAHLRAIEPLHALQEDKEEIEPARGTSV